MKLEEREESVAICESEKEIVVAKKSILVLETFRSNIRVSSISSVYLEESTRWGFERAYILNDSSILSSTLFFLISLPPLPPFALFSFPLRVFPYPSLSSTLLPIHRFVTLTTLLPSSLLRQLIASDSSSRHPPRFLSILFLVLAYLCVWSWW